MSNSSDTVATFNISGYPTSDPEAVFILVFDVQGNLDIEFDKTPGNRIYRNDEDVDVLTVVFKADVPEFQVSIDYVGGPGTITIDALIYPHFVLEEGVCSGTCGGSLVFFG